MRKTKIICTLGPSTDKEGVLRDLIANGMNVARFNFSHGSHEEHLGRLEKLKALREELGKGIFLVAEQDGEVQGYVGCQTVLDEGYITNVAVSPDFRRQGIARALIAELTAKAGENKLAFVTLEVRESNAPAIALYTGAGFAPVGKRKNFYSNPTENAVLMTISLT